MEGLRSMRMAAGISQAELARRVGVSAQAVMKWEKGLSWPSAWYIPVIAEALDCRMEDLYKAAGSPGPQENHKQKTEGRT